MRYILAGVIGIMRCGVQAMVRGGQVTNLPSLTEAVSDFAARAAGKLRKQNSVIGAGCPSPGPE